MASAFVEQGDFGSLPNISSQAGAKVSKFASPEIDVTRFDLEPEISVELAASGASQIVMVARGELTLTGDGVPAGSRFTPGGWAILRGGVGATASAGDGGAAFVVSAART